MKLNEQRNAPQKPEEQQIKQDKPEEGINKSQITINQNKEKLQREPKSTNQILRNEKEIKTIDMLKLK